MNEPPSPPPAPPRFPFLAVIAAAVASVVAKLIFATQRGFWLDEYYTLAAVQMNLQDLVRDRLERGHSPLPFLYAKFFHDFVGTDEWSLKLSSALAAGAAVAGIGALAWTLGLRRIMAPLLLLAVCQPYWQELGTEFRYTMPLVALAVWSAVAVVRWVESQKWRWALAVVGFAAPMLWWHGSAQFVLWGLLVFVVCRLWGQWKAVARGVLPLVLSFLLSVPLLLLISSYKLESEGKGTELPSPRIVLENVIHTTFGEEQGWQMLVGPAGEIVGVATWVLAFGAIVLIAGWVRRREPEGGLARDFLGAQLLGIPAAILVYTTTVSSVQGPERYVAFLSVPGVLALSIAVREAFANGGRWPRAWAALLCVTYPLLFVVIALDQGDWHRESCRWLAAHRKPDEPIITMGRAMNEVGLRYHGLPWVGTIVGVDSESRDVAPLESAIRENLREAEAGWLFLYRPGRAPIDAMLESLRNEGFLVESRRRFFSREMSIVALARTKDAEARMQLLDEAPAPWLTGNPPKD